MSFHNDNENENDYHSHSHSETNIILIVILILKISHSHSHSHCENIIILILTFSFSFLKTLIWANTIWAPSFGPPQLGPDFKTLCVCANELLTNEGPIRQVGAFLPWSPPLWIFWLLPRKKCHFRVFFVVFIYFITFSLLEQGRKPRKVRSRSQPTA